MHRPLRFSAVLASLALSCAGVELSAPPALSPTPEAAPSEATRAVPAPSKPAQEPLLRPVETAHPRLKAPVPGCGFDTKGPRELRFAAPSGGDLLGVWSDGTTTTLRRFGDGLPKGWNASIQSIASRDGRIVVAVGMSDACHFRTEVVAFDLAGNELWHLDAPAMSYESVFIGAHGRVAIGASTDGVLVEADGRTTALPKMVPIGPPDDSGAVPVLIGPQCYVLGTPGWLPYGAAAATPVHYSSQYGQPRVVADRLVYVTDAASGRLLVSEGPNDVRTAAIEKDVALRASEPGGFLLLGGWSNETGLWRADLRTMKVEKVALDFPKGMRRFQYAYDPPQITADGSVLMGLRDDDAGALFRSSDLGASWVQVGGRTRAIEILGLERNGTFLVHATNNRYAYEPWPDSTTGVEVPGPGMQVVRPSEGVRALAPEPFSLMEPWSAGLSDDGLCLGYWRTAEKSGEPDALEVLDVSTGTERTVFQAAGAAREWPDVTWVH